MRSGFSKDGRADKTQRKGLLSESITTILKVKAGDPVPSDVVKTAQAIHGVRTSYNEAWRSLNQETIMKQMKDEQSFNLIAPYLRVFSEKNPEDSGIQCNLDEEQRAYEIFILRGTRNNVKEITLCATSCISGCMSSQI